MALSRQQKRFAQRLIEDEAKVEFITQKQGDVRLIEWDKDRNALISKRAEVALVSIILFLSYCFLVHG
jgi:hypothetical protein